ncbi:hypothetical protein MCOR25_010710 [Pyricularia grisea]|uniref:Uncharacterized protein n=1 Tax=Pyricularia grisea TaxID=148305 RepID=A0A6P8BEX2_PYRGI|nr:uncharacterized protein PgNI_04207 [Pyricularia grisea]KAI6349086.1 hypothetical protein MCOR25_010710 [Pyricularia grisea]TLD14436.1 hypothetical protein PgNI_04207 [Pyricularia grisea]
MHIKALYAIAGFTHLVIAGPTVRPVENLPPIGPPPPRFVHGEIKRASVPEVKNYPGGFADTGAACPNLRAYDRAVAGNHGTLHRRFDPGTLILIGGVSCLVLGLSAASLSVLYHKLIRQIGKEDAKAVIDELKGKSSTNLAKVIEIIEKDPQTKKILRDYYYSNTDESSSEGKSNAGSRKSWRQGKERVTGFFRRKKVGASSPLAAYVKGSELRPSASI